MERRRCGSISAIGWVSDDSGLCEESDVWCGKSGWARVVEVVVSGSACDECGLFCGGSMDEAMMMGVSMSVSMGFGKVGMSL